MFVLCVKLGVALSAPRVGFAEAMAFDRGEFCPCCVGGKIKGFFFLFFIYELYQYLGNEVFMSDIFYPSGNLFFIFLIYEMYQYLENEVFLTRYFFFGKCWTGLSRGSAPGLQAPYGSSSYRPGCRVTVLSIYSAVCRVTVVCVELQGGLVLSV